MNKRQKKKFFKKNLIKIKKLHLKAGDVICLMPDLNEISIGTISDFLDVFDREKVFQDVPIAIIPCDVSVEDKYTAEKILEKSLSKLREGGE